MRYLRGENLKGCPEFQQLFRRKRRRFPVHPIVVEALYKPRSRAVEEPLGYGCATQHIEDLRPFDFPYPDNLAFEILHSSFSLVAAKVINFCLLYKKTDRFSQKISIFYLCEEPVNHMTEQIEQAMSFICKDITIDVAQEDPFKEDKLDRAKPAPILTSIADVYADSGAVLAIDGEWGSGKTTFVRMWRQYLINNGYKTLYFNAWETDFIEDPLIALMGELKEVIGTDSNFEALVKNLGPISLKVGSEILKTSVKKLTGLDSDCIKAGIDEATEVFQEKIKSYNKRKVELEEFKNKLGEYVASVAINSKHPIALFIDELDRCNPHYAVKLLERVKHLFEVPNIIFVLAVNIKQLQYAIQGYYGSSNVDGQEYLKRFIDLNYTLPAPNLREYTNILFEIHAFNDFFNNKQRLNPETESDGDIFLQIAQDLISYSNTNLRLANKIFAYTRIVLQGFPITSRVHAGLLFLLCFIKITTPDLYRKIQNEEFSIQELIDSLETVLPDGLFNQSDPFTQHHLCWPIATLILRYNYQSIGIPREKDFEKKVINDKGEPEFPIQTKKLDKKEINSALNYYISSPTHYVYGLKDMLNRINLTSKLKL